MTTNSSSPSFSFSRNTSYDDNDDDDDDHDHDHDLGVMMKKKNTSTEEEKSQRHGSVKTWNDPMNVKRRTINTVSEQYNDGQTDNLRVRCNSNSSSSSKSQRQLSNTASTRVKPVSTNMATARPDPPTIPPDEHPQEPPPLKSSTRQEFFKPKDSNQIDEDEEDLMVAQARALALNAEKQLARQKKSKATGLNMLMIHNSEREELPLGDIEQRKLIEAKLEQQKKSKLDPLASINHTLKPLAGLADVRNKFEGFIQEQQQKLEESLSHFEIGKANNASSVGNSNTTASAQSSPTNRVVKETRMSQDISNVNVSPKAQQQAGGRCVDMPTPTLCSIVYKKRSGYGKYSAKNAWERRRMDLVGTTLRYFATPTEHENSTKGGEATTSLSMIPSGDETLLVSSESPMITAHSQNIHDSHTVSKPKKDIRFLWEQAKENITKTTENFATSLSQNSHNLDPNAPRGTIDLIKENAIVAAMSVSRSAVDYPSNAMSINMGAAKSSVFSSVMTPTPFGICIVVKNEVKWKICFDTQREQMQWLALLTEIIIRHNVDMYNEGLILSRSRRGISGGHVVGTTTGAGGGTSDDSGDGKTANLKESVKNIAIANAVDDIVQGPPGGSDNSLWQMDQKYAMSNWFNLAKSASNTETIATEESVSMDENSNKTGNGAGGDTKTKNSLTMSITKSPVRIVYQVVNDGAMSGPSLSLTGTNVLVVSCIFNIFLKIAYSLESIWRFWFCVLIANTVFWLLTVNDNIKGEDQEYISFLTSFLESRFWNDLSSKYSNVKGVGVNKGGVSKSDDARIEVRVPVVKEGFKPIAGSTTKRVRDESDSLSINGERFISWCVLPSEDVLVRSHGYLKTKKKVPSPPALYEIIGCDVLNSRFRLSNISSLVQLPKMGVDESEEEKTWNSPDVFSVSLAVPTEEPSMTRPSTDGEGFSVIVYYKMKKETRDILKRVTAPGYTSLSDDKTEIDPQRSVVNAVKLWEDWCSEAPCDEKMQARFKFIPNVHNPKEVGLPSYIAKYCGKPVLIKRANVTGFLSAHPDINAMEFGISLHPFPYLAKKAMAYLKSSAFPKAILSLSYVIEGRSDTELPEVLIGDALKLLYPDPDLACDCDAFLSGVSKSSIRANESANLS